MDGLFRLPLLDADLFGWRQRTLKAAINCVGIGIHSGRRASLVIRPAEAGHGIVFRRTDLGLDIAARFDNVCETRLCTVLAHPERPSARVGTVEHLLAALSGLGIDNALIEVDGPEVPILDGSAGPFLFLLDCAGSIEQDAPRRVIEVCRPVRVAAGDAFAELRPLAPVTRSAAPVLEMDLSIEFAAPAIGRQSCSLRLTPTDFPPPDRRSANLRPRARTWRSCRLPVSASVAAWIMSLSSTVGASSTRAACAWTTSLPTTSCWMRWATWRWQAARCTVA